ncbi:hypothetical protein [Amycolatopsis sp. NPDC004625]|uniref:hypothetical protein n=1 Tax=Amycolatopsis sp. NPDC004625 TaxID=3154670 RepID=UPI0033A550A5
MSAFLSVESVRSGEYSSLLRTEKLSVEFAKDGSAEFGILDRDDSSTLDDDLRQLCALLNNALLNTKSGSPLLREKQAALCYFIGLFPDDDQQGEFFMSFSALRYAAEAGATMIIDAYPPEAGSFDGDDRKWFAASAASDFASSSSRIWHLLRGDGDDLGEDSNEALVKRITQAIGDSRSTLISLAAENGQYGIEVPLLGVSEKSDDGGLFLELRTPPPDNAG